MTSGYNSCCNFFYIVRGINESFKKMNKAQMNSVGLDKILDTQVASRKFHMKEQD